jgi:hypothetical protein
VGAQSAKRRNSCKRDTSSLAAYRVTVQKLRT